MIFILAVGAMTTRRKTVVGKASLTVGQGGTRGKGIGSTDNNKSIDAGINPYLHGKTNL